MKIEKKRSRILRRKVYIKLRHNETSANLRFQRDRIKPRRLGSLPLRFGSQIKMHVRDERWICGGLIRFSLHQTAGIIIQSQKVGAASDQVDPRRRKFRQTGSISSFSYAVVCDLGFHHQGIISLLAENWMGEPSELSEETHV